MLFLPSLANTGPLSRCLRWCVCLCVGERVQLGGDERYNEIRFYPFGGKKERKCMC